MIIEWRNVIKNLFKEATKQDSYYQRADKEAKYPYSVFDIRRIGCDNGIGKYVLEVNCWDHYDTNSRVVTMMEDIEKAVHKQHIMTENGSMIIYKGNWDPVEDNDKDIKRVREQFEMQVVGRSL